MAATTAFGAVRFSATGNVAPRLGVFRLGAAPRRAAEPHHLAAGRAEAGGETQSSSPICAATATAASPPDGEEHANYSKRAMALDQVEVTRHFGFSKFPAGRRLAATISGKTCRSWWKRTFVL
jgi:hypothetical protein